MPRKVDMERRRRVWEIRAAYPTKSGDEIAAELGIPPRTAYADLAAAEQAVNDLAATTIRAGMIERDFMLLGVYLPAAIAGDHKAATIVLQIHKELRGIYRLDPATELTINYRHIIERVAVNAGLTVDEVMEEAKRILAEAGSLA